MSQRNYPMECCKCTNHENYIDLQDAYDHGWFRDDESYCPDHAEEAINKVDTLFMCQPSEFTCVTCKYHRSYANLDDAIKYGWVLLCNDEMCCSYQCSYTI